VLQVSEVRMVFQEKSETPEQWVHQATRVLQVLSEISDRLALPAMLEVVEYKVHLEIQVYREIQVFKVL